jgi:hypothetical protein
MRNFKLSWRVQRRIDGTTTKIKEVLRLAEEIQPSQFISSDMSKLF